MSGNLAGDVDARSPAALSKRRILTPKEQVVRTMQQLNDTITMAMTGHLHVCVSADYPAEQHQRGAIPPRAPEPQGLPPHELRLKEG